VLIVGQISLKAVHADAEAEREDLALAEVAVECFYIDDKSQ
jgi:hypothetical protein